MPDDTSDGDDHEAPPFDVDAREDGERPVGDLFETVSDRRTRYVLAHLESLSVDVVDLDDVAEHVARRERAADSAGDPWTDDTDVEAEDGTADDEVGAARREGSGPDRERHRRRVAVTLHHNHLPRLDAAAVLDYDPRSRTVRYWGDDRVSTVLGLLEASEGP
ncbi:DUF7344 domain-containing protein [Halorussus sp. AFM4]|uniref:DUF7344 domain-containing protein n=1 Tax=Halorussus sp. AFM4 TaxID=3421651 RepID=UPI003EBEEE33